MIWTDLITPDKWQLLGGCNCGGTPKKKFRRIGTDFELQVLPNRYQFKLFKSSVLQIMGAFDNLESTLNQYSLT